MVPCLGSHKVNYMTYVSAYCFASFIISHFTGFENSILNMKRLYMMHRFMLTWKFFFLCSKIHMMLLLYKRQRHHEENKNLMTSRRCCRHLRSFLSGLESFSTPFIHIHLPTFFKHFHTFQSSDCFTIFPLNAVVCQCLHTFLLNFLNHTQSCPSQMKHFLNEDIFSTI